jgi:hypothetical protein
MAVKAMFKAGCIDEGEKLAALFTRDAVKGEQVGGGGESWPRPLICKLVSSTVGGRYLYPSACRSHWRA